MADRLPIDQNFLTDLVARRVEAPDVEYKRWMPLTDKIERANIARHICALANYGGGWLVFGFEDDGNPSEPYPDNLSPYSQDAINAIGERYLTPNPHCEVHLVRSESDRTYPVIRIPSHGDIPICAKRDGPQANGQPQGIRSGTHYIRVAGPQSVPINSPEPWRDVLRRCVFAQRDSLLASIGQIFDGSQLNSANASPLEGWLEQALARWADLAPAEWPIDIDASRIAFAFRLLDSEGNSPDAVELNDLERMIREASFAAQEVVREGAPFEAGWDMSSRAKVTLVDDREAYEAVHFPSVTDRYTLPAMWRVSVDGVGVEITAVPEDNPWVEEAVRERGRTRAWPSGKRLAPTFQTDMMAQRIAFVRKFADNFAGVTGCELMVDYLGLEGRTIDEPRPGTYFSLERSSMVNQRRNSVSVGIAATGAELPEVTAALIAPIFRLFDGWDIGAEFVNSRLNRQA